MSDAIYDTNSRYSTSEDYAPQPQYQESQQEQYVRQSRSRDVPSTVSQPPTRPATPSSATSAKSEAFIKKRDARMVLHDLQIPTCISPNGGDLADFTAQVSSPRSQNQLFLAARSNMRLPDYLPVLV